MKKCYNMNKLILLLCCIFSLSLSAQEEEAMKVERGKAVERESPIRNIYVDSENNRWVGNTKGLYQVHSINHSTKVGEAGQFSLLRYRSGNYNLTLPLSALNEHIYDLNGENEISAAHYDAKRKELWVGTSQSGLYQFKLEPQLQLVKHFNSDNSVLNSNYIKNILIEPNGRYWIGTEEGMVWGNLGKWKVKEKYVSIEGIATYGGEVWVLGDEWLWRVNSRNKWGEVDVDPERFKGLMTDIAVDSKGRVWIASEIITRFDPESGRVEPFAGPEEFTSQYTSVIAIDENDALWVGTRDKGLFIIEKEDALTVTCLVDKPVSCDAFEPDGALKVTVVGGIPPYTYQWSGNLSGDNPQNLGPGDYEVTVTDSEGRQNSGKSTILNPGLRLTLAVDQPESGAGASDGKATASVEGGQPDYRYQWDNGETAASATKLTEGAHSVTVVDKAGCEATASIDISQNIAPLSVAINQNKQSQCAGDAVASLTLTVSGGKEPFQYQWNKAGITGAEPTNLAAGNYQVTISDSSGKNSVATFEITSPEAISAKVKMDKAASTGNADGQASVKVDGGKGPYTYLWDNGEKAAKAVKLGPGDHQLTITDAAGCTAVANSSMTENILPLAIKINEKAKVNCNGEQSAALEVLIEGGKGPFQYQWSDTKLVGAEPNGLGAGSYEVQVIDATGQKGKAKIKIKQPDLLAAKASVDEPASTGNADGKASIKVSGGSGSYTYQWDTGEKTAKAVKLGPGDHNVTISDATGCSTVATVTISENILALAADVEMTSDIKCNGTTAAALQVTVKGGKAPYTYEWSDNQLSGDQPKGIGAGTYEVNVTDASGQSKKVKITVNEPDVLTASVSVDAPASTNNADGKAAVKVNGGTSPYTYKWDTGESVKQATKLGPGEHIVTITDAAGCQATANTTITENVLALSADLVPSSELKCNGENTGALAVTVKGGKTPFTYQWSDSSLSGDQAKNLKAGDYEVTVSDASGKNTVAKVKLKEPQALIASANVEAAASTGNEDGKALASAIGGAGDFTYLWDNGEKTARATKLAPGEHRVTITDKNGCTVFTTVTIKENVLAMNASIEQTSEIKCFGETTAAFQLKVNGGKAPFDFKWNNASVSGEAASNVEAGDYKVVITDATGQTTSAEISIKTPEALSASLTTNSAASTEVSLDGRAVLEVKGGSSPYTYAWDNGETANEAKKLPQGEHRVEVKDANGCSAEVAFETKRKIIPRLTASKLSQGETVRLEKLYFDADSSSIKLESIPVLDELYDFLKENGTIVIQIGGHTNNIPSHEFCDKLSTERAQAVASYMVQKGIDPKRVLAKGFGKRKPVFTNKTKDGRRKNQRVEVKILSI